MFGNGNVYGETNLQANHESSGHWDLQEKKHMHRVKGSNTDHMNSLLAGGGDGGSQPQSPRQLNFARRKWCQVDSEARREQSVLQKSAINALGGHLKTFSSNGASSLLDCHLGDEENLKPFVLGGTGSIGPTSPTVVLFSAHLGDDENLAEAVLR